MRRPTRCWVFWALTGLLLPLWAGCGGGPAGTGPEAGRDQGAGPKLLFITNSNADWWNAVEKGMDDGGKEFGCQVQLRRNNGDTQGQVDRLREALTLPGIQGVAVSVIEADAPGVIDAMRELKKAGKVVIAIDSDVAKDFHDARQAYIGTNNVKAGEAAGKAAALLRPKGGKVAVFVGTAAAANARDRRDGFFLGAGDAFPQGQSQTWEDGGDHTKALTNVQTAVTRDPNLDTLLGLWSYNAPAIAEVVQGSPKLRKQTTVVTFDLDEATVGHIERGDIDVSVCQNPYEMGFQGVRLLKALIDKDDATVKEVLPDGETRDTGVRVIVPTADSPVKKLGENVITIEEMKSWLASKGLKSS
ncbi:MAG: substrate-binding domain-containing protein [Isosphaeraceae bacterium]